MKRFIGVFAVLLAMVCLFAPAARAGNVFHPPRVRLLIHGGIEVQKNMDLRADFIPAGNLLNGLAPMAYLGIGLKPMAWLDFGPFFGWSFGTNEPIMAYHLAPAFGKFYGWADVEYQPSSGSGYWFAQLDYKILGWLHAGIEGEGWGCFKEASSWSHGGGPNLLFRTGQVGVDLTLHIRELEESVKPEFFTRFHLFL